jgi:uncharacterized protein (TIGR02246 family)
MSGPDDLAEWIDKLAIQELVSRYTSASTRGDWDGFEDLFTADASWELPAPMEKTVVGGRAIREDLEETLKGQDFFMQMTHDAVVELHGPDVATGVVTIHAIARKEGQNEVVSYAVYYDDYVKIDGAWRFARRRLQPIYMDMRPLPGFAPISRADLARRGRRG